jgi:hypothetical protein
MVVAVSEGSPEAILQVIERILAGPDQFSPEFENIAFGDWAAVHVARAGKARAVQETS